MNAVILGGAVLALLGLWRHKPAAEIYGCSFSGVGFLVWAVAAVLQPEATTTSWGVAFVFLYCSAGQLYRAGMVSGHRVVR